MFETRGHLADLAGLGIVAQRRLEAKLRDYVYPILRQNPNSGSNIKRLKNWDPPTWRYRAGDWRFFYEIDEKQRIVSMTAADHRNAPYR
jgi:mRNA interferase RelE/StbE